MPLDWDLYCPRDNLFNLLCMLELNRYFSIIRSGVENIMFNTQLLFFTLFSGYADIL